MRVIHNWYSCEYRYTNIKKWVLLLLVIVSITLVCIGQQVECGLTVCFYYLRLSTFSHLLRSGYVNLLSTDKSMCMILYFPCRQHKTVMFYSDTLNMLLKTCSLHFTGACIKERLMYSRCRFCCLFDLLGATAAAPHSAPRAPLHAKNLTPANWPRCWHRTLLA